MREYLLYLVVAALAAYAWRNWFASLCGLILLAFVATHRDFPSNIAGIQGLNPWNILLFFVALAWLISRRRQGFVWDMPRGVALLLGAWVIIILAAGIRCAADVDALPQNFEITTLGAVSENIINPLKYLVPGLMLYDGCRTRPRVLIALACLLTVGAIYGLLVIKTIPLTNLLLQEGFMRSRRYIGRDIGLHPNNMGPLLAGFFWATIASLPLLRHGALRVLSGAAAAVTLLGTALTHSRGGYVSLAATGMVFGLFRWRPLLVILPLGTLMVAAAFPSIPARLGLGFGMVDVGGNVGTDWDEVTAGRITSWPFIFEQIRESPFVGFGREACLRRVYWSMSTVLGSEAEDIPNHPHNAYLEQLLDAGAVGLAVALALYGAVLVTAIRLCREKDDVLVGTVGAMTLACVTALLAAGVSGQTFWPSPSSVFLWCFCGILLRVWVTLRQVRTVQRAENTVTGTR